MKDHSRYERHGLKYEVSLDRITSVVFPRLTRLSVCALSGVQMRTIADMEFLTDLEVREEEKREDRREREEIGEGRAFVCRVCK